jgi:hypothetical protein
MIYRLCGHTHCVCNCDDLAAQPCIAACIETYLDTLRDNVIYKGEEGAPGDDMDIGSAHNDVAVTCRGFATLVACERWSIKCGCGAFLWLNR